MKIFFSVGEPSGDLHGANLVVAAHAQRPEIECVGFGGPKMAEAGCLLHEDLTKLAVMWFARALLNLHKFLGLISRADRYFRHHRPDAVVLIDYPGFNWWVARRAKAHGIPVFYYGAPQIWAWAGWRIRKMRRYVDHVLCKLPFEEAWYGQRGCNATYVGHPYFDELSQQRLDPDLLAQLAHADGPLVAILPGSRTQEVTHNLPWFLKAAEIIRRRVPNVRFAVASFKPSQAAWARDRIEETDLPIEIHVQKTAELISASTCTMAVSGSVSLELLYHTKPSVILYWVSPLAYFVQRFFRKVKYITLVNLLSTDDLFPSDIKSYDPKTDSEKVPMPEYLTSEDKSAQLAEHVVEWLTDAEQRDATRRSLSRLKERVSHGGASNRAAAYLLEHLAEPRQRETHRPHHSLHRDWLADAS